MIEAESIFLQSTQLAEHRLHQTLLQSLHETAYLPLSQAAMLPSLLPPARPRAMALKARAHHLKQVAARWLYFLLVLIPDTLPDSMSQNTCRT